MGLAAAAVALAGVGTAVSAYSAFAQGAASSANADYQAQVAKNNQTIADQNAKVALEQGQEQEQAKREQTAQTISQERAITASSGIDPNRGSSVRIQGSTAALGELDAQTIRNNAARTSWGYQAQGLNFGAEANLLESQASNAAASGAVGAFSSIIGGASSVANKWITYKTMGAL